MMKPSVRGLFVLAMMVAALPRAGWTAERPPGQLVWDNSGQPELDGSALSITSAGGIVVATGNVCLARSVFSCNWFVRAVDSRSGRTLWEDRMNAGAFDRSQSVAVEGGRVFASGWFQGRYQPATGTGYYDFVVRAYDLKTGTPLWQQRIDRGANDFAEKVTVRKGRVFAVGRVRGASGTSDFAIFAFAAATGAELWESVTNISGTDIAFSVVADDDRVFAAGPVHNFSSLLVVSYDARTGAVAWEDEIPGGLMFTSEPRQLAVKDGLLFLAAGVLTPSWTEDPLVRAYDAETGAVRWTRQLDGRGNGEAFGVSVKGDRLFVVGEDGADADFLSGFFTVWALDRETGAELWQDRFQATPGGDAFAADVVASDRLVLAGGRATGAAGDYEWTLRIYDGRTGTLLGGDSPGAGGINALALGEERLYAAGFKRSATGSSSFTLRAYEADFDVDRGDNDNAGDHDNGDVNGYDDVRGSRDAR